MEVEGGMLEVKESEASVKSAGFLPIYFQSVYLCAKHLIVELFTEKQK